MQFCSLMSLNSHMHEQHDAVYIMAVQLVMAITLKL